ncbi:MAG: hypothetical protein WEB87_00210 [Bacteriovoracaceae bacterium]
MCELIDNKVTPAYTSQDFYGNHNQRSSILLCRNHDKTFFLKGQDQFLRENLSKIDLENSNHKDLIEMIKDIKKNGRNTKGLN